MALEEHEQQQRQGQQHVELRQAADALLHAADHRDGGQHHHQADQDHLHREALGHVEHVGQPVVELHDADAEAGGDAEYRGDHRGDVHGAADGAVDALAQQRIERAADRQRQAVAIAEVGQRHAHQHIEAPAGESPVQVGLHHGIAHGLLALRRQVGRCQVVGHRLGDAEEQQVDADAGGEQHRRPGEQRELRPGVVGAEADAAEARAADQHHEDQVSDHGQHVVPAEGPADPGQAGIEEGAGLFGEEQGDNEEDQDAGHAAVEDHGVEPVPGGVGGGGIRHGQADSCAVNGRRPPGTHC